MYRFGDSTPFPLESNFIDTLVAVVDACIEIFRIDAAVETSRVAATLAQREALKELERLTQMRDAIVRAAATSAASEQSQSARASQQVVRQAEEIFRRSQDAVVRTRDSKIASARVADVGPRIRAAVSPLLLSQELPKSRWTWSWRASSREETYSSIQAKLDLGALIATFDGTVGDTKPWGSAISVAEVAPGLVLQMQIEKRRRTRNIAVRLDGYCIVEMERSTSGRRLKLEALRGKSVFALVAGAEIGSGFRVQGDDGHSLPQGLSSSESEAIERLWAKLVQNERALLLCRRTLRSLAFAGADVDNLERPAEVAELIFDTIAPLVREMRMRSLVPGELILKRDTGKGQREELFVPRAALQKKLEGLAWHHRRAFDAVGLSTESTVDFVARLNAPPVKRAPAGKAPLTGRRFERDASKAARVVAELAKGLQTREHYGFDTDTGVERVPTAGEEAA